MSNEYYIIQDNGYLGPYDLVALVIKIRNGSLTHNMQIQRDDSTDVKPANEWQELSGFFDDGGNTRHDGTKSIKTDIPSNQQYKLNLNLFGSLKMGLDFLQNNQVTTLLSGFIILLILVWATITSFLIPDKLHTIFYIIGFVFLYFILSCYMILILRMTRGQPIDFLYFLKKIKQKSFKILMVSLFSFLPSIIGFVLFLRLEEELFISLLGLLIIIIPGIFTAAIYSFAPLLIADKDLSVWEAMEASRACIMKDGSENFGVYFSLNAINFIAGLFMLLPMVITLPVTMSAMTEYYDEMFS